MKYAIYLTHDGRYRATQYVDNLDGCKNILGGQYVKEEDLPILVNRMGGHCSFTPNEEDFVKIVECNEDEEPLTREEMYPKNWSNFKYGWIDTEGNTYTCGYEGHHLSAHYICEELGYKTYNGERELEKRGWVKVTARWECGVKRMQVIPQDLFVTKKQYETLFDLGLHDCDNLIQAAIYYSEKEW